jgi:beta-glucanase (GH16 family)
MRIIKLFLLAGLSGLTWGCIKEDDGTAAPQNLPEISISDLTVDEGDQDLTVSFDLSLTGPNATNAVVDLVPVAGTAEPGIDYKISGGGRLVFAPDETQKTVTITLIGDELREGNETFTISVINPINARVNRTTATVTIRDDDSDTGLVIPATGYTSPDSYPGYDLAWADEFEGDALDPASWMHETGDGCPSNCGWGNNELEYYRPENTLVQDGYLIIEAKKQSFGGREYTSSRILTKGKRQFKYGRIDIRAAVPEGQGIWPALWMLGANIDQVGWPATGEIDIMELVGHQPDRVHGTVHFGNSAGQHQQVSSSKFLPGGAKYSQEFHVFSLNWEEDQIQFLVDNEVFQTITPASLNGAPYPFNKNFFFIFNVAVGGNWPGSPDNTTPFPQRMIVDYVRVFQK